MWINLGPLLYHFADSYGQDEVGIVFLFHLALEFCWNINTLLIVQMSIEISLEDVKRIVYHYGFQLEVIEALKQFDFLLMQCAKHMICLKWLFEITG